MDFPQVWAPWGPGTQIVAIGIGSALGTLRLGSSSGAWPTANKAFFLPVRIDHEIVITKFFTANGATASGNLDVGLYTLDGTRLLSTGTTAQAGTTTIQVIDVTDTLVARGNYYLALAHSSTAGTYIRLAPANATVLRGSGLVEQTSAFALPATATFAANSATYLPLFGALCAPVTA